MNIGIMVSASWSQSVWSWTWPIIGDYVDDTWNYYIDDTWNFYSNN